jgi:hypothetical protein
MKRIFLPLCCLFISSGVFAKADCVKHPKSEWIKESEMKKRIKDMGYAIKTFKVSGDCYEIYGHDKDGRKSEVYFDTKNADIVKKEIEGT